MSSTPETVHAATAIATVRRLRAIHYGRVTATVDLVRLDHVLDPDHDTDADEYLLLAEALDDLGIRPPGRHVDQHRRRYPSLHATAEATPDTGDDTDLLARLNAAALRAYAADLLAHADTIADLEADPLGAAERHGDTDGLAIPLGRYAEELLEDYRDRYDALVGESFTPTHTPR